MTEFSNRNTPGTKLQDTYLTRLAKNGEFSIEEMDSSFALQQYLQLLIHADPSNTDRILKLPPGQDADVWQYEQLRSVCSELNGFIMMLLQEECTAQSCPEMKAQEWLYLCAAHLPPQSCCAIDYCAHTLDGATALLNSNKAFPSRVSIPEGSLKHFQSIARRLYRIFAHAWFHHKQVFTEFEERTHLYDRFVKFSDIYKLIPAKLVIIPEGYRPQNTSE